MGSEGQSESGVSDGSVFVKEDRLQGRTLRDIQTCFVGPATATPGAQEWLPLSQLDYLWMVYYTPLLTTFTVDQVRRFGKPTPDVVQHWKDSLAEALVLFYPLAGRVFIKDDDSQAPRIHCNDAGAEFTEASVDADLAELRPHDFQPLPLLSGLASAGLPNYPTLPHIPTGLPALIIQVTHFKCGGITLAANWSHAVADGHSGLHFMKSWSEIASGAEVSVLPDHRRDLMKPRDPPVPIDIAKGGAFSAGALSTTNADSPDPERKQEQSGKTVTITQMVEFSKDEIAQLRNSAAGADVTRADCVSTHLWRTVTRARETPSEARVRFWVLIEGRKRCGLPEGYFGNVTGVTSIITTVDELVNGPIATTASLIHAAIAGVTGEWFQGLADAFATSTPRHLVFAPKPLGGAGRECGISYLVRFPYYDLEMGLGCRPAHSTRNTMGAWDGLVFVLPSSRGTEHMVAFTNLDPHATDAFVALAHHLQD